MQIGENRVHYAAVPDIAGEGNYIGPPSIDFPHNVGWLLVDGIFRDFHAVFIFARAGFQGVDCGIGMDVFGVDSHQ